MKLLSMKSGAFTCLTAGWLLAASLGAHAAPTVDQMNQGPADLPDLYMECADGTRFSALLGELPDPALCDDHGGVKGGVGVGSGGGGIGGGHNPPIRPGTVAPVELERNVLGGRPGGGYTDDPVEAQDYNSTRSNRRKN